MRQDEAGKGELSAHLEALVGRLFCLEPSAEVSRHGAPEAVPGENDAPLWSRSSAAVAVAAAAPAIAPAATVPAAIAPAAAPAASVERQSSVAQPLQEKVHVARQRADAQVGLRLELLARRSVPRVPVPAQIRSDDRDGGPMAGRRLRARRCGEGRRHRPGASCPTQRGVPRPVDQEEHQQVVSTALTSPAEFFRGPLLLRLSGWEMGAVDPEAGMLPNLDVLELGEELRGRF